MKTHSWLN